MAGRATTVDESVGSRIFKARVIGGPATGGDDLTLVSEFPSKQLLEDPFGNVSGYGTAIQKPPYSLEQLVLLAESHPPHAAALEQKAMDVVGQGPRLVPIGDETDEEQEADITTWLDDLAEQQTFIELLHSVWLDYETTGWGMLEVARDLTGAVRRLYHVPAHTVRAYKDKLRYVQIRGGRQVWFKRWGAELEAGLPLRDVPVLATTGRKAPEGTHPDKLANELLVFVKSSRRSTWYGIPTYISAVGYITLALAARDYNVKFFANAREPRYAFVVSGLDVANADELLDELTESLKTEHADPHKNLLLGMQGNAQLTVERLTAVQNDMHFTKLMDVTDARILEAHRVPPDRLGVTLRGFLGGNIAANINRIYKDAVVVPAQSILADRLGRFVSEEYARAKQIEETAIHWRVEFEAPDISDEAGDIANVTTLLRTNAITLNEGREKLGLPSRDDMDVTLAEYLVAKGAGGGAAAMAMSENAAMMANVQRTQDAIMRQLTEMDQVINEMMDEANGRTLSEAEQALAAQG